MRNLAIGLVALVFVWPAHAQFAEPNDRGVSFGHMHLVVADLERHKQLWPELFGAELVEKQGYSAVRIADALIFFREAEPTAASTETAVDHFGLRVRDLGGVLSKWQDLGFDVDSKVESANGGVTAFITMPGGIRLALDEDPNQTESTTMGHVQFSSPLRGELLGWYKEYFGVENLSYDAYAVAVPGSELRFGDSQEQRLPTDGAAIDHIGFEVQEWDAFLEALRQSDIQFEFGPVYIESLDLWVAFFNDPSGVLVEITHGLNQF